MSAWNGLGQGTRGLILGSAAVLALGVGYMGWQVMRPPMPEPAPQAEPAAAPAAAESAATLPDAEAAAAPGLPQIDTWRVAPDGEALVAGLAVPEAEVSILVDGATVATGAADAAGEFALLFTLAPNASPSLMRLSMTPKGEAPVLSEALVAIAPIVGKPEAVPETEVASAEMPAAPAEGDAAAAEAAAQPPQAVMVTGDGAVVVQDALPADEAAVAHVMIDTIAYTPEGEVLVGGRGTAGAGLRLYVDNAERASATVPDGGQWQVTLGDTPPGIYTLRVDQVNGAGTVTSRFETPFQRETLEDLAIAAAAQPALEPVERAPEAGETVIASTVDPVTVPEGAKAPETVADTEAVAAAPVPDLPASDAAPDAAAAPEADAVVAEAQSPAVIEAPTSAPAAQAADPVPALVTITVQPGFTLWGIAQDTYGDGVMYVQVFEANREKIVNPDLIYPGQVLSVPGSAAP